MKLERAVELVNTYGLHARPASHLVALTNRFESDITVRKGDEEVDGKSVLHLMTLAAAKGTVLHLTAEGHDAQAALDAISELVASGFGEDVP